MKKIRKHPILYDLNLPEGHVHNVLGLLNKHEMSIVEIKILENLVHNSLGIWAAATPSNPKEVANGATAVFYQVRLAQWKERTIANRFEPKKLINREVKKVSHVKEEIKNTVEIDITDLDGITMRDQYLAHVLGSIMKTLTANMDAIYLEVFVLDALAKHAAGDDSKLIVNANWLNANTKEQYDAIYLQAADARVDIARFLDAYDIGADERDFAVILHKKIQNRLLIAMPKGGDSATDIGRNLTPMGGTWAAGLGVMADHIYLNQRINDGQTFREDKTYDFRNVVGVIAHKEAAFVAVQKLHGVNRINGDGNQEYIYRVRYFQDLIRDNLYGLFVTSTNFSTNTPNTPQEDVNQYAAAITEPSVNPYKSATKTYEQLAALDTTTVQPADIGVTFKTAPEGVTLVLTKESNDASTMSITVRAVVSKATASAKSVGIVVKGSDAP